MTEGASLNEEDKNGNRPIHLSSEQGHLSVTKLLLEKGANPALKDEQGYTPLHNAAYWGTLTLHDYLHSPYIGHHQCCLLLLENVTLIEEESVTTPLHLAAFKGRTKVVQLFLTKLKNLNAKDEEGATALHKVPSSPHHLYPILQRHVSWAIHQLWNCYYQQELP